MKYLLDAKIIAHVLNDDNAPLRLRLAACDADEPVTSSIAFAEVALAIEQGKDTSSDRLRAFIEEVPILPFDDKAARVYATLPFRRRSHERLIAAHALSLGLTVVTEDIALFTDIADLNVENWAV